MVGCFLLVRPEVVEALLANPSRITELLEHAYEDHGKDMVDVDKAWHCLHYLLTGTAWEGEFPANFMIGGGTEVGDVDVGYGPARVFGTAEVAEIARLLATLRGSDLAERFDARDMERRDIYPGGHPGGWSETDVSSDESFGYFIGAFEDLKALVTRGAAGGSGMVAWLN